MREAGSTWLRRNAMNVVTAVAVVAAVTVGIMAARRLNGAPSTPQPRSVSNWGELVQIGTRLGPPAGTVRLVEFGDYQCPSCARAAVALEAALADAHAPAVGYIHLPLTAIHPAAFDAAVAAECASAQHRFPEMHRILFRKASDMQKPDWTGWAREAGVPDLGKFEACLGGDVARKRVQDHAAMATRLGIAGTPAFVVDGELLPIGTPIEEVMERIR